MDGTGSARYDAVLTTASNTAWKWDGTEPRSHVRFVPVVTETREPEGAVQVERHELEVAGVRTSWLAAGEGPVVLLLHGGAWGECAATAWSGLVPVLAEAGHRVLAPDWLGFGYSDKLRDFVDLQGRMVAVLAAWLGALGVVEADAVGLSMGGANLLRDLASERPRLPLRRVVLASAGGAPLTGAVRAQLGDYDGTRESMRRQVALACADSALAADDAVVDARVAASLLPGAYEVMASLGLRGPAAAPPPPGDPVPYERIVLPVLVVVGGRDRLKPARWADAVVPRLAHGRVVELPEAGHCVQLDAPAQFAEAVLSFLSPLPEVLP